MHLCWPEPYFLWDNVPYMEPTFFLLADPESKAIRFINVSQIVLAELTEDRRLLLRLSDGGQVTMPPTSATDEVYRSLLDRSMLTDGRPFRSIGQPSDREIPNIPD
jgi:hypothetical protein